MSPCFSWGHQIDLCSQGIKYKIVCAQNLMSDFRLLYKQYTFCEEQKELTDELLQKSFYQPRSQALPSPKRKDPGYEVVTLSKMFPKSQKFPRVTEKRHSRYPTPPKRTIDVSCWLNRYVRLPQSEFGDRHRQLRDKSFFPRGRGDTPYTRMIGLIVVFFRGSNRRFSIFRGCSSKIL